MLTFPHGTWYEGKVIGPNCFSAVVALEESIEIRMRGESAEHLGVISSQESPYFLVLGLFL